MGGEEETSSQKIETGDAEVVSAGSEARGGCCGRTEARAGEGAFRAGATKGGSWRREGAVGVEEGRSPARGAAAGADAAWVWERNVSGTGEGDRRETVVEDVLVRDDGTASEALKRATAEKTGCQRGTAVELARPTMRARGRRKRQ